jgi:hypothetical protein
LQDREPVEMAREEEFADTARLIALITFGAAWENGKLNEEEKQHLRELVATLNLSSEDKESFSKFYSKPLDLDELEKKLRYFNAEKKASVAYAFSFFGAENKALTRSQKNFLKVVSRACGVPDGVVEAIIGSVKERKRYFAEECDTNLCTNCSMVYPVDRQSCPVCGMLASSVAKLTTDQEQVVCGTCGINYRNSDFPGCPRCGNVNVLPSQLATPVD